MVSKHIGFSESIVFRELEKIAQRTNLVTNEPVIQKTASIVDEDEVVMLETSGNLFVDSIRLAEELRNRGFEKQASSLEDKAVILKRAMSESGSDSLYDFWKETGESVVNFAHKTTNVDVAGYKPKNVNEVKRVVENSVRTAPTGDVNKALKMAGKVGELLKKYAQEIGDEISQQTTDNKADASAAASFFSSFSKKAVWNNNIRSYMSPPEIYDKMYKAIGSGLINKSDFSPKLELDPNNSLANFSTTLASVKFVYEKELSEDVDYVLQAIDSISKRDDMFKCIVNANVSAAKQILNKDNDDSEDWSDVAKNFAKYFIYKAVKNNKTNNNGDYTNEEIEGDNTFGNVTTCWTAQEIGGFFTSDQLISHKAEANDWIIAGLSELTKKLQTKISLLQDQVPGKVEADVIVFANGISEFINDAKFVSSMKKIAAQCVEILQAIKNAGQDNKDIVNTADANLADMNIILKSNLNNIKAAKNTFIKIKGLEGNPEKSLATLNGFKAKFEAVLKQLNPKAVLPTEKPQQQSVYTPTKQEQSVYTPPKQEQLYSENPKSNKEPNKSDWTEQAKADPTSLQSTLGPNMSGA